MLFELISWILRLLIKIIRTNNVAIIRIIPILFLGTSLVYYKTEQNEYQQKVMIQTTSFQPYIISDPNFYTLYREIPSFFDDYEIHHVHEELDSSERAKRYLVSMKDLKYVTKFKETSRTFILDTDYLLARNVIVTGYSVFGRRDVFISLKGVDNPNPGFPVRVTRELDSVIALTHFPISFSSCFYNVFFAILVIPMDVIKRSNLIVPVTSYPFIREIYDTVFGYKELIMLDYSEYLQVKELHTVINPTPGISHYSTPAHNFSILYREKFNLTKIKATEHVLINREKQYARHLKNFDELVAYVRENIPEYKWTVMQDKFSTMLEAGKEWAKIKVLLTPTGSNLVRCIAMSPGTAILCIFANRYDWEVIAITQVFDLFLYVLPIPAMRHYVKTTRNILDPERAVKALRSVCYASENGRWSDLDLKENFRMFRKFKPFPN